MTQVIPGEDLQPHANKIIMPLYKLSVLDDMHLMKGLPPLSYPCNDRNTNGA